MVFKLENDLFAEIMNFYVEEDNKTRKMSRVKTKMLVVDEKYYIYSASAFLKTTNCSTLNLKRLKEVFLALGFSVELREDFFSNVDTSDWDVLKKDFMERLGDQKGTLSVVYLIDNKYALSDINKAKFPFRKKMTEKEDEFIAILEQEGHSVAKKVVGSETFVVDDVDTVAKMIVDYHQFDDELLECRTTLKIPKSAKKYKNSVAFYKACNLFFENLHDEEKKVIEQITSENNRATLGYYTIFGIPCIDPYSMVTDYAVINKNQVKKNVVDAFFEKYGIVVKKRNCPFNKLPELKDQNALNEILKRSNGERGIFWRVSINGFELKRLADLKLLLCVDNGEDIDKKIKKTTDFEIKYVLSTNSEYDLYNDLFFHFVETTPLGKKVNEMLGLGASDKYVQSTFKTKNTLLRDYLRYLKKKQR